ncbi:MAG: OmpP1/FadL family transporter [Pseudomonadota bacterium]
MKIRHILLHGFLLAFAWACGGPVRAELATNIAIDVKAMALGNAVTADPPGIMAIHFNPAGLAKLEGRRVDLQFIAVDFALNSEFSAPPGYDVFGFSDDPVVCADPANDGADQCREFKVGRSSVEGVSLYIPVVDEVVDLPPGPVMGGPLPAFSIKPPGSKVTFANAIYAPMLAGFHRAEDDPGNYLGERVAIERITYLSPSVGWQVNDEWSVGGSVGLSYQAVALQMGFRSPNELLGFARVLDEDICAPFRGESNIVLDIFLFGACGAEEGLDPFENLADMDLSMEQRLSPTYNLGVLWEPNEKFAWGLVWQSEASMDLKGKYTITYEKPTQDVLNSIGGSPTGAIALAVLGMPTRLPPTETGLLSMGLTYPAHLQTGIKYRFLPRWKMNVDLGWTDYAKWNAFNVKFDRNVTALSLARLLAPGVTQSSLSLPLGYQSVWSLGMGLEYDLTDRLTLRFGLEPRASAIPEDRRSPMVPINEAMLYGLGMGYKWDRDSQVDVTFSYIHSKDAIPADSSCAANCTGIDQVVYNPYAGLDIRTEAEILYFGFAYRTTW